MTTISNERYIGREIKTLSNMMKRRLHITTGIHKPEFTHLHRLVIRFLYENQKRDIFQRDIEAEFHIRRSTATGLMQRMEKNGYITRESVDYDARLKKIVLTQKSFDINSTIRRELARIEMTLSHGLTDDELKAFFLITDKIKKNLEQEE